MKKVLFILFILFILYSAHFVYYNFVNPPDEQTYMTNKVMFDFSNQQYKKRKLILSAIGKGRGEDFSKFDKFALDFLTKNELTIDSGRKLLLDVAKEFLKNVNENKELEKYLYPFPFDFSNVSLSLCVTDPIEGYKYYPEGFTEEKKINYLILSRGIITYYVDKSLKQPMQEVYEEKVEDALNILKENNEI